MFKLIVILLLYNWSLILPVTAESDYLQSWQTLWTLSESASYKFGHYLDTQLTPFAQSNSISSSCQQSLFKAINGLKTFDINYVRMFDSWGKLPSGLLFGSWTDLGSLDQCVALENSQYCLLTGSMPLPKARTYEGLFRPLDKSVFNLTDPLSTYLHPHAHMFRQVNLTFGLCLPRACSSQEMTSVFKSAVHSHGLKMKVNVDLCQYRVKSGNPILLREYIALAIVLTVIGLNILGTLYPAHHFLGHFNFVQNWCKLISTGTDNQSSLRSYPFLDCFKFFSMVYIIVGHVGWGLNYDSFHSLFKVQSAYSSFLGFSLLPGYLASEVYFLIIGLELMTFFLQFKGQFNLSTIINFLAVRWARFMSLVGFNLCIYILVFSNHVRDLIGGPFWSHLFAAGSIPDSCSKRWHSHLLLYSHHVSEPDNWNLCMMPDWFLQVDFALAFLFLAVLLPLRRSYERLAISIAIFFIFLGPLILGFVIHYHNASSTWLPFNFVDQRLVTYLVYIHIKPYTHTSPYFIGVLLAFVLQSKNPIISKQIHRRLGWLLWSICISVVLGYEVVINYNIATPPYLVDIIYSCSSRIFWSFAYAWPIYCLHYGFVPESVQRFTCSGFFKPMSRINLTVLFMNEITIRLRNGTQNYVSNMTPFDTIFHMAGPIVLFTYVLSFIISPMVDGPSISLVKSYFRKQGKFVDCQKESLINNNNLNGEDERVHVKKTM